MKILYYIHALYVGGAETLITNYLISLREAGNDVVLVVNLEKDTFLSRALYDKGIKIIPLNRSSCSSLVRRAKSVLKKVTGYSKIWEKMYREEKPDVVHIHTFCDSFEMCNMDPRRVFYSFHSDVARSLSIGSKKNAYKLLEYAKKGMNFTALSHVMVSDIKEKIMAENVFYVPNAIDLKKVRSSRYDKEEFLKENGLPADAFIMGHVGRFHPVKNHEKLFSVFAEIHKRCSAARLLLVGTGSPEEIDRVENLKKKYNVCDITLMLGLRSDATAIMSVFDAFVLPSFCEGLPLVLLEAEAQGVRCVVSNVVPAESMCEGCISLDPKDSDEAWANAILSSEHKSSQNQIEEFDINGIVAKLVKLYAAAAYAQ